MFQLPLSGIFVLGARRRASVPNPPFPLAPTVLTAEAGLAGA